MHTYNLTYNTLILLCLLLTTTLSSSMAQETTTSSNGSAKSESTHRSLEAAKINPQNGITLDGKLEEIIWQQAPVATDFIQRSPNEGDPATEKTEARVIYSDNALYVGIRAYDSAMDSIAATLFRRDGSAYSDWVYVSIDSYNDNRTSFSFAVNPRGVRKDILTYNDDNEDIRWDAVWEVKTTIQQNSWIAEMRIPLSQLRFDSDKQNQTWGINFQRRLARKEEISFWSPTPQNASGFVSRYGNLKGIADLPNIRRLEISPYASGSLTRSPGEANNPFYNENDWSGSIGADVKYGITSDFTLTGTINPDFGQVEADPAVINLSAYETFFPEQRPFFQEGTDIFEFGRTQTYNTFGNPIVFYSRRIGRQPQGDVSDPRSDAEYIDTPDQTTIASAAKISGKTDGGFSLGILDAFTLRENAQFMTTENEDGSISVEPPTNYFVGRVKQDINEGQTVIGAYGSAVNRMTDTEYLKNSLHSSAYISGMDFEHSWDERKWILSGTLSGTQVNGSKEAIEQTQQSSARYYNRVDADYLSVDPNKTNLNGYAGEFSLGKFGGDHWKGSLTYSVASPGYEVNDIGFQNRADYHAASYLIWYQETDPAEPFRNYNAAVYANHSFNFGGDMINNGYGFFSNISFTNLWRLSLDAGYSGKEYDDRLLRGGPLTQSPKSNYYSAVISTDESKTISFSLGHFRGQNAANEIERDVFLDMTIRPTPNIQISVGPNYNYQKDTDQYVDTIEDDLAIDTYGHRYVFADTDRKSFSTSLRLDWTFTPEMSLQTYLRPFISSGDFYNFKEFTTPRKFDFDTYGEDRGTIQQSEDSYIVDPDGNGPAQSFSFDEQDFNFKAIQTNAVFRWEYIPGSTFYLVWQQDRSASTLHNDFRFRRDVNRLFESRPTNVFLMKFSYWFGT